MGGDITQVRTYQAASCKFGLEAAGADWQATANFDGHREEERDYNQHPFVERVTGAWYDLIDKIGREDEWRRRPLVHYRVASAARVGLLAITIDRTVRDAGQGPRD
jgi:hypothetical protein